MKFQSFTGFKMNAEAFCGSYNAFVQSDLIPLTDTRNAPKNMVVLRELRDRLTKLALEARHYAASEHFGALTAELRDDISAIADEIEKAIIDIDEVSDPDLVWPRMSREQKLWATEHFLAPNEHVARIRARIEFRLRGVERCESPIRPIAGRVPVGRAGPPGVDVWQEHPAGEVEGK